MYMDLGLDVWEATWMLLGCFLLEIFTNGKMDLDSSPTDSEGLELVLHFCCGGDQLTAAATWW